MNLQQAELIHALWEIMDEFSVEGNHGSFKTPLM